MSTPVDNFEDGVLLESTDVGTLAVLNKSEIDQQISTAKKYPRSIEKFRTEAFQLATLDEQTAAECIYALPRGGKTIEGPSARFAEIIAYAWGNERFGARMVSEDQDFVTSQGVFYDLERNLAISYEVRRRITDSRNKRYSADMITMTANAASSIAMRNAVLKGIPKAIWRPVYDAARKVVAGDVKTLANKRANAIAAFAIFGVTPAMIFATLGVKGEQDIGIDHLVALSGFLTSIKEGDTKPEEIFAKQEPAGPEETPEERAVREKEAPLRAEAEQLMTAKNFNAAQREAKLSQYRGRMAELVERLKTPAAQGSETAGQPIAEKRTEPPPSAEASAPSQGNSPIMTTEYVDPADSKCSICGSSFGVHLKTCSKFVSPTTQTKPAGNGTKKQGGFSF